MEKLKFLLETRSLKDYIGDKMTVGGTYSDRILLFDIDDTLIHSDAKINIMKDGEVIKEITPAEYNYYRLKEGESFDYSDFRSYDTLVKSIMLPFWNTLKKEYRKGTHIGLLTAREDADMFKKFCLAKGIDIKDELIFATGDNYYSGSVEERKTQAIERLYKVGYRTFIFFDDSETNLQKVKEMEKKLPIKIHTIKA